MESNRMQILKNKKLALNKFKNKKIILNLLKWYSHVKKQ